MQSGIGEVVLRRETVAGKRWGKMSRITGYIQPNRRPAFFRNCWFRETGSRLRSAKISTPSLALVNRNYPTKRNECIEGGRGREKVNRNWKIHARVHVWESFSSLFLGLLIKIKTDLFPWFIRLASPRLCSPSPLFLPSFLPSFLSSFLRWYAVSVFRFDKLAQFERRFSTRKSITDQFFFLFLDQLTSCRSIRFDSSSNFDTGYPIQESLQRSTTTPVVLWHRSTIFGFDILTFFFFSLSFFCPFPRFHISTRGGIAISPLISGDGSREITNSRHGYGLPPPSIDNDNVAFTEFSIDFACLLEKPIVSNNRKRFDTGPRGIKPDGGPGPFLCINGRNYYA